MITLPISSTSPQCVKNNSWTQVRLIGQENLLRILVGYTTRELSTASIVQNIYRARSHGDLMAPGMLSVERPWPAHNIVHLIRILREKCESTEWAPGATVIILFLE